MAKIIQPDDPPFLTVGTEVSAKYKGAFCEAKVNKVVRVVKVKVNYKNGLGSYVVNDDDIKGILKVGAEVKALHYDKGNYIEAVINKIQDCSQYTVVFDDGDITTLKRSSLCLKSGRHFAESETLDQLPLTHPEHFGTPVVGGRRGRRHRHNDSYDDDSEEEETIKKPRRERESDIGKVLCVEIGDKKKQKDNWFPGLVVASTAQDSVKIDTKKDYLVRSFQDGRYYTVPKKESFEFTKEVGSKVTLSCLKAAVEKAYQYLDNDQLPPHWDRELLFGNDLTDDDSINSDSYSSDDEPNEEKDHFVAQLYKHMEECGTPINKAPTIANRDLDLYKLFQVVQKLGGYNRVANQNQWKVVASKMGFQTLGKQSANHTKSAYKNYLQSFDEIFRKLGCTMVNDPRSSRTRHRSGRSLIRDCDRAPRSKKKSPDSGDSAEDTDKKEDEKDSKKPEKEAEKKIDVKNTRNKTPPSVRRMSPSLEKSRELKIGTKLELRKSTIIKKEEIKKEKEESASEEEAEAMMTRSHRNREESKDKEEVIIKRGPKRPRDSQRSASCTSSSSATSSSSGSFVAEVAKIVEKKPKITRSICIPTPEELKKRGRKKKVDDNSETPAKKSALPASVSVNIGDRLLVVYGPNNKESKVTYEAKVIKVDAENNPKMFYVHYRGWNIRYDEWVGRDRIEQNLTWRQTRSKKKMTLLVTPKTEESKDQKKIKQERTASPAPKGTTPKRVRANSFSQKDCKEEKSDSGSSISAAKNAFKTDNQCEVKKRSLRIRSMSGQNETSETDDLEFEGESDQENEKVEEDIADSYQEPSKPTPPKPESPKQPCGKDIDLKTIESEMKGLEKPRKDDLSLKEGRIMSVIPVSLTIVEKKANDPKNMGIPVRLVPAHEVMGQIKPRVFVKKEPLLEEDIYEFKEPEPFEMGEMRSRKDSKCKGEEESDVKKKSDEAYSPAKTLELRDCNEPTLKIEPNKELKDYTRKVEPKERLDLKKKDNDFLIDMSNPCIEILNQGRQTDSTFWKPGEKIDLTEHFDMDSCDFLESPRKICKRKSDDFESKIDPVPIKSEEHDILPLEMVIKKVDEASKEVKAILTPKKVEKTTVKMSRTPSTLRIPSPLSETRRNKFTHKEERMEGKLLPFSQRQQHIFPHLLNRSDASDDKTDKQGDDSSTDPQSEVPAPIIGPFGPHRPPTAKYEAKKIEKPEEKLEKSKIDTSVEETIEAVVLKARNDQMQAEENNKNEIKLEKITKTESKPEKRRKNPVRLKKSLVREYADTSEDSEADVKYENERNKKLKADSSKYSPAKRPHRLSTEAEKSLARDEEERANDADNEDNENHQDKSDFSLHEEFERMLKAKKKRRTSKKSEDSEETLGDLLCEETFIPGSPMTQESAASEVAGAHQSTKQEMPFASVPTGSSFGKLSSKERLPSPSKDVPVIKEEFNYQESYSFSLDKFKNKPSVGDSEVKKKIESHCSNAASPPYPKPTPNSATVIDNTPPTTPESISSNISDSPPRENDSSKAEYTSKSGQSSELDFDNKLELSEDSNTTDSNKNLKRFHAFSPSSASGTHNSEGWDTEDGSISNSTYKRRKNQKQKPDEIKDSSITPHKRRKIEHMSPPPPLDLNGLEALNIAISQISCSRNSKFNYCKELDPEMDSSKKIATLESRMQELRQEYMRIKTDLAAIERRRKKLRKKVREKETVDDAS